MKMRFVIPTILGCMATMLVSAACIGVLPLERGVPLRHQRVDMDVLTARDETRHARMLQGVGSSGATNFSLKGTCDPNSVGYGLYYAKVKIGSPPREFRVQIDTGSDILWVNCNNCSGCPQSSEFGFELNFYDTARSSTSALVQCNNPMCVSGIQNYAAECNPQVYQCVYKFQYADGSGTSGYYVSDAVYFDGQSPPANSSPNILFGCSTYQSGGLTKTDKAVDGIFGFGPGVLSAVSQLSSQGKAPKVFYHCLKGDGEGGGILVLGETLEPSIVYTPLVPSQDMSSSIDRILWSPYVFSQSCITDHTPVKPHYKVDLQSIAVNGKLLSINQTVFATSNNKGTIIDSGTTLAFLVEEAFVPLVNAITTAVSQSSGPVVPKEYLCYLVSTSVDDIFPPVSLNFAGGASMVVRPAQYLMHYGSIDGATKWCIGFRSARDEVTVLGDLVLKDKIVVYDLANQRFGWTDYDCSMSVNVSLTTSKDEYINGRQSTVSSSEVRILSKSLSVCIVGLWLFLCTH